MRAAPRPVRPLINQTMMHGIVMHVIHRRPEMPVAANRAIRGAMKTSAAAGVVFPVPIERRVAVKLTEQPRGLAEIPRLNNEMVMVGEHAPREDAFARRTKCFVERGGE